MIILTSLNICLQVIVHLIRCTLYDYLCHKIAIDFKRLVQQSSVSHRKYKSFSRSPFGWFLKKINFQVDPDKIYGCGGKCLRAPLFISDLSSSNYDINIQWFLEYFSGICYFRPWVLLRGSLVIVLVRPSLGPWSVFKYL